MSKIVHVIVDTREHKLQKILAQRKDRITYEVKQLEVADIVITKDVAIERKEGSDYVSSISDGRLFEQLVRLKDAYPIPILIIEGLNDKVMNNTGMSITSIYGALAFVSYKLGISVIPTRHISDTAITIERIAYREQVKDDMPIFSRRAPKSLSKEEKRVFIIEGLLDTGPKKAQLLIEKFKTPYQVFKAVRDTEITFTKSGNPKGIRGPLEELSGFGWKFIQKNKTLLFGKLIKAKSPIV